MIRQVETILSQSEIRQSDIAPLYLFQSREANNFYGNGIVLLPTQRNEKNKLCASSIAIRNPEYIADVLLDIKLGKIASKRASLRPCLLHNKSDKKMPEYLIIETAPKWLDNYRVLGIDFTDGFFDSGIYQSNSHRSANYRKIKALDKFCNVYEPLYRQRKISMLMFTLTGYWTHTEIDIKEAIEVLKLRLARHGKKVLGYIWTFEISEDLHPHYHIAIAVERMNIRGGKLPKYMFIDDYWGARTQVAFVKKNIRHYLAKYFAKNNFRALNYRSYGTSSKYLC